MENLSLLALEKSRKEATKYMTKFINSGNEAAAIMWAEKLDKIVEEIESRL